MDRKELKKMIYESVLYHLNEWGEGATTRSKSSSIEDEALTLSKPHLLARFEYRDADSCRLEKVQKNNPDVKFSTNEWGDILFVEGDLRIFGGMEFFPYDASVQEVYVPKTVQRLEKNTFYGLNNLKTLHFSPNCAVIPKECCGHCSALETVIIPEGVKKISSYAFVGCSKLKSIRIPESMHIIEDCAFYGCENLTEIWLPKKFQPMTGFTLKFSYGAFDGCGWEGATSYFSCTEKGRKHIENLIKYY